MNVGGWRNQGELARYPFVEGCTLQSTSGQTLPEDFLVDAQIYVSAEHIGEVFLSSVIVVGDRAVCEIRSRTAVIGSFTLLANQPFQNADILDSFGICRGRVVGGSGNLFASLSLGENSFTAQATSFEASCLLILPKCVSALSVDDLPLFGKVALVEGEGIALTKEDQGTVRIDALGSAAEREACCPDPVEGAIRQINGAVPNQYGDIRLELGEYSEPASTTDLRQILRIKPTVNGLVFSLARPDGRLS